MGELSSWRKITIAGVKQHLLVKYAFKDTGYDVYITDFGRVWHESLTRSAIVERAMTAGCSIDPSENDQYHIMLDKIKSSLNGEENTIVSLLPGQDGQSLEIMVSASLPRPLPTFRWTAKLIRANDDSIATHLVLPLMYRANQLQDQIQFLFDEIHAKDRVISKITDRLESSGNDLTSVFPGMTNIKISRKKAQRPQLARFVKGLADFNEDDWRSQLNQGSVGLSSELHDQILTGLPHHRIDEVENGHMYERWWAIPDDAQIREPSPKLVEPQAAVAASQSSLPVRRSSTQMSDSDFQRQDTPPRMKGKDADTDQKRPISQHVDVEKSDESTEDEEDLGRQPKSQQATSAQWQAPRRLGSIGGPRKQAEQSSSEITKTPESPPTVKSKPKLGTFRGKSKVTQEAASSGDGLHDTAEKKSKAKLGRFGGKNKSAELDERVPTPDVAAESERSGFVDENREVNAPSKQGTQRTKPVSSPSPGAQDDAVDSQERADEKRNQLKRELETKAKAPTKKKRKF